VQRLDTKGKTCDYPLETGDEEIIYVINAYKLRVRPDRHGFGGGWLFEIQITRSVMAVIK
jgi:hypothetical protein